MTHSQSMDGPKAFPMQSAPGKWDSTLSMAVLVYLGVGISAFPTRLPDTLAQYVGSVRAEALQGRVEALRKETVLAPSEWMTGDLGEIGRVYEARMRKAHPELSEDAIKALAWDFTYSIK